LLTSVALTGDAPYESVVTHGFVVDGQGRKFSKSLGNGVTPGALLDKYGMDIIRLWVGGSDYAEEVRYSPQIMDAAADQYRALRNAFRWLLGNLPENGGAVASVAPEALPELERYILHRLGTVLAEVRAHYDAFQFHTGVRTLQTFISTELSNLYFDVRKDTLYCDRADSPERVACVWVLEQVFRGLVTHLAPVIPFTTDEAWRSRYGEGACVHVEEYAVVERVEVDVAIWRRILDIRQHFNANVEAERTKQNIGANAELKAEISLLEPYDALNGYEDVLRMVLNVSEYSIKKANQPFFHDGAWPYSLKNEKDYSKCPRCWRYYPQEQITGRGVCLRCEDALSVQGAV
jgi:isoleucyl-tRNA synthetase